MVPLSLAARTRRDPGLRRRPPWGQAPPQRRAGAVVVDAGQVAASTLLVRSKSSTWLAESALTVGGLVESQTGPVNDSVRDLPGPRKLMVSVVGVEVSPGANRTWKGPAPVSPRLVITAV